MPRLRDKTELANLAQALAVSFSLVEYMGRVYMPVNFLTKKPDPLLQPDETVWVPMSDEELKVTGNIISDILFYNDAEVRSYIGMIKQTATRVRDSHGILVRVGVDRVMLLDHTGELKPVTGNFVANYIDVPYDAHRPEIEGVYKIISEWVGGDDQAKSLLYHLATALQPTWSARKYVLLIGPKGMNGKSTLLKMFQALLGLDNTSELFRQDIASRAPIIAELNGKLANIVFDGPKEFVKDSSAEKSLTAGEAIQIEMKYENIPKRIHTNALFIEGLQAEPKVSDKSPALQKRLVRFSFKKEYAKDLMFEERMLSEEWLAGFLGLLLLHWVNKNELDDKLALTAESLDMQMEAVWANSSVLRFLEYIASRDEKFLPTLVEFKMAVDVFMTPFRGWLESNGYKNLEDSYVLSMLEDHFELERKTIRPNGKPTTRRCITAIRADTMNAINTLLEGGVLDHSQADIEVLEGD